MKKLLGIIVLGLFYFTSSFAESTLPKCEGDDDTKWVNCFGTVKKELSTSDKKIKRIANYTGEYGSTPGKPGGKGVSRVYENGIFDSSYEGEWKEGNPHGQGTETKSSWVYVGEWKNSEKTGQGTYALANGDGYVGEVKNGLFHGQGTYTFVNEEKYIGEWKDGNFVE